VTQRGLVTARHKKYFAIMKHEFSAEVHREGEWFIAFCPEVPEANGQGKTKEECLRSLASAIELVFEERRDTARQQRQSNVEEAMVAIG
jgi:predicted RNase H-like HicB family nuclease